MHLLFILAAVVCVGVVIVIGLAAQKPDEFRMQRSAVMKADAGNIFPHINDFHNWAAWSPFEKLDRNMTKTFTGAASGRGSIYEWSGNKKAGAGRMEIVESSPPDKVTIQLEFLKPFKAKNTIEFTLLPRGDSTEVTWAMHGSLSFAMKVMHVFVNMDRMIGRDFEEGLNNLTAVVQKP